MSKAGWPDFRKLLNKILYSQEVRNSFRHYFVIADASSCQVLTGFITSMGIRSVA
jgi:hypothetical protein